MAGLLNYSAIHAALVEQVALEGAFTYVPAAGWLNLEYGVFPESLRGNSFTIRLDNQGESSYESVAWLKLMATVEFCLDGMHDRYLTQLANAVAALQQIASASQDRIKILDPEVLGHFTTIYFADKVVVTFSPVHLEIDVT